MTSPTLPDAVAWRIKYPSEPGMIGQYPWSYTERRQQAERCKTFLSYDVEPLYTAAQLQEAARLAMEECRRLVLHEVLHLEDVNCDEDVAYNTAIHHAQTAIANRIRALADVAGEKGVGNG